MQIKEYERTIAQKNAIGMAAMAEKNQVQGLGLGFRFGC